MKKLFEPVELKNLTARNRLIFIEKTGHTCQMKHQELADHILRQLHQSKQIRTISSKLEMGSDFAFSSGNFLPPTGSRENGKQDGKEDLL